MKSSTTINQTVLITGASAGIGAAFARVFAGEGYNLILVARAIDRLQELKSELEKEYSILVSVYQCDLSDPGLVDDFIKTVIQNHPVVDVLVNNAGCGMYGPYPSLDAKQEERMIQLNVLALTKLTKAFLPGMLSGKKGHVLNVASTAAFQPGPLMSVYYATKAFVLSYSEALSKELEGSGVAVTCLCPGATASEFQSRSQMEKAKFLKIMKIPSSLDVARYGFLMIKRGKVVAVHGTVNKILVSFVRLLPRSWGRSIVYSIQRSG